VKKNYFENSKNKLREIYRIAVSQNTDALMLIQDQTFNLCLMAVKKNASALQWVNPKLFSKDDYGEICYRAFYQKRILKLLEKIFEPERLIKHIQNYQALRFVNKGYLYPETYKQICSAAIEYSAESLPFVDEDLK
jgi:hypothetical protein